MPILMHKIVFLLQNSSDFDNSKRAYILFSIGTKKLFSTHTVCSILCLETYLVNDVHIPGVIIRRKYTFSDVKLFVHKFQSCENENLFNSVIIKSADAECLKAILHARYYSNVFPRRKQCHSYLMS